MRTLELFSTQSYNKALNFTSLSKESANKRHQTYDAVMQNFYAVRDRARSLGLFSNSASVDLQESQLGVTLKEASISAYLDSFAGYIAVERPLTQMRELLVYKDYVTKGTGAVALPFLGDQKPRKTAESKLTSALTGNDTIQLGSAVVPGSIMIVATTGTKGTTIVDDRKGKLISEGGVLAADSTINYATGELVIKLTDTSYNSAKISFSTDALVDTSAKRIKARQGHFLINAKVNKFEYEYDLIMDAITNKTTESSVFNDIFRVVREEHQMAINNALVDAIVDNYAGNKLTIDVSTFSTQAGMFDSLLRVFKSGLVSVDTAIAKNCNKVVSATAYVVGTTVGDVFNSMSQDEDWVPNNTGFVNGLLGFYRGRPVLRHLSVSAKEGYAIHKTANGELAPTALGILLPATDLPNVGNFLATNEIAGGIYSVEGTTMLTNDLVQKFAITLPSDWNVVTP